MSSPTPGASTINQLSTLWLDPDPQLSHGVLLSDRIRFYVDQVRMIDPFSESHLGPASYDLTLGSECWYAEYSKQTGQTKRTLSQNEFLIVPPNSIVFVSTAETLTLPFYLVGRFNLKLRLLHEGLLVGAGPQIDPGFVGRLSCPLHNISSEKVSLKCGDAFAVIEFHKTTPFASEEQWNAETTVSDVRLRGESRALKGVYGYPCITFPTRSLDREPVKRYVPAGKLVTSSIETMASDVGDLKSEVEKTIADFRSQVRTLNVLAYLTVSVVAITLGTYFWGAVNWTRSATEGSIRAEHEVRAMQADRKGLELKVLELERKLNQLSEALPRRADRASSPR